MGLVLIGLLGLAIDTGWVYLVNRQLQDAADAAALSGAMKVSTDTVTNVQAAATQPANNAAGASVQFAYTSGTNDSTKDIVIGTYNNGTFTATTSSPNAVKVTARRTTGSPRGPLNLFFGPIFGINTAQVSRTAIAHSGYTTGGAGLVLIGTSGNNLNITGGGSLVIDTYGSTNYGSIWADSSTAVTANGNNPATTAAVVTASNSSLTTGTLNVVANETQAGNIAGSFTGTFNKNAGFMIDPLAWLSNYDPSSGLAVVNTGLKVQTDQSATPISQGIYSGGITVNSGGKLKMNSGIYVIDSGLDVEAGGTLDASSGVLIYLRSGPLKWNGGTIILAPMSSGTYAYLSLWQAYANTNQATLVAGANSTISGALYFPTANVKIAGSFSAASTGNQIIASSMTISGQGHLTLTYDGSGSSGGTPAFSGQIATRTPYLVK